MAFEFTDSNFQEKALGNDGLKVVDFGQNGVVLVRPSVRSSKSSQRNMRERQPSASSM